MRKNSKRQKRNNTKYGKRGGFFGFNFFGTKDTPQVQVRNWDGEIEQVEQVNNIPTNINGSVIKPMSKKLSPEVFMTNVTQDPSVLNEPVLKEKKILQKVAFNETSRVGKDEERIWKGNYTPVSSFGYTNSNQNILDKTNIQKIRAEELGIDTLVEKDVTKLTNQNDSEICNEYDELLKISPSSEYKTKFLNGIKKLEKVPIPLIKNKINKLNQCPSRKTWFGGKRKRKTRKNKKRRTRRR